jgi:hypothetical protein
MTGPLPVVAAGNELFPLQAAASGRRGFEPRMLDPHPHRCSNVSSHNKNQVYGERMGKNHNGKIL